ncbi:iron ABC transporter permease [Desulfobulbus sp. US5]|nr:iron ABC transporter permease [Desulfobulbus sp. US4]MCW5214239.1 iron ABC transporter permease [Desulfobulbus sp. US5]WLE96942.1 MAG: iron ABC transporter permease [Candidatus Electrothrix communis]
MAIAVRSGVSYITGGGLFLLLLLGVVVSATMGFMQIPATTVLQLIGHALSLSGKDAGFDPVVTAVVMDVRLPRILAAVLVGGMLALCGTVFQAILLNPLADPYTLGISSGAAFGASLVIVLQVVGLALPSALSVPIFAFAGSIGTLFTVLALASEDRRLSSTSLILSGVIVAAILSAAIGFLKFIADEQVGIIIFWLMGSLSGISRQNILLLLPVALIGMAVCLFYSRDLNIMATGERAAATLGVNTVRLRWILLITCSLMTALCVSVSGIIGFVGLIVPHLLRHLIGPDNRQLIILSTLGGGLLLLLADTVTRAVLPAEVPIGVLTALIGGPFFAYIFKKRQQENG